MVAIWRRFIGLGFNFVLGGTGDSPSGATGTFNGDTAFNGGTGGAKLVGSGRAPGEGRPPLDIGALIEPGEGICKGLRSSAGVGAGNCRLGKPSSDCFLNRSEESAGLLNCDEGSNQRWVGVGGSESVSK